MKVVLISHLNGKHPGDVLDVKPGYAKNYLFLKNLAMPFGYLGADKFIEAAKQRAVLSEQGRLEDEKIIKGLAGSEINFVKKATVKGKLYGGITRSEIAKKLGIDEAHLDMKEIKEIGKHEVPLLYLGQIVGNIQVVVEPQK